MDIIDFVAKKFQMLNRLEVMSQGMKIEEKVKKDVDIEKQVLQQFLIMCATLIRNKYEISEEVGAEIFEMYDCKLVIEKKSNEIILGGNV